MFFILRHTVALRWVCPTVSSVLQTASRKGLKNSRRAENDKKSDRFFIKRGADHHKRPSEGTVAAPRSQTQVPKISLATEGLSKKTLEECLAKRCFQTDHCLACLVDDPANFILMPSTLNTKFSFHSAQQFKKDYTGTAWTGAVHLVKKAIAMYRRVRS